LIAYQVKLKEITNILLKAEDNYVEIKNATDDLYNLFLTVSGLKEVDENCRKDYYLPQGKAIGTVWAAMCIKEFVRTKKFIRGVYLGIKSAQNKFPNRPIHILYAGTGPFATLLMTLTTVFTSEEVKFTLLEINPDSIKNLNKVIEIFRVEEYVKKIVQCDATKYQADKGNPIHMVVTETMQRALNKEPQVAITLNLIPQMLEGGILIPENITVTATLVDLKRDMERMIGVEGAEKDYCYPLNKIFELNKDIVPMEKKGEYLFPKVEVEIPNDIDKRFKSLNLFTDIQVFGEEKLTYMQCSLNLPHRVKDIDLVNKPFKKINFEYVISENPRFVHKILE